MKQYKIELIGHGGEYHFGFVKDKEEREKLNKLHENGELDINIEDLEFYNYDEIISVYGQDINSEFSYTVTDMSTDEIIYDSKKEDFNIHSICLDNPYVSDYTKEQYDWVEGDIAFGGVSFEKNLSSTITFDMGDEIFDKNNLFFGVINMDETLNSDEVVVEAYYINKEVQKDIINKYIKEDTEYDISLFTEAVSELMGEDFIRIMLNETEVDIETEEGRHNYNMYVLTDEEFIPLEL